ncbi:hypothetical protein [Cupriavidus necator]
MSTNISQRFVFAFALVAAATGAQATGLSQAGMRGPHTDAARSVLDARNPFSDGAHSIHEWRSS